MLGIKLEFMNPKNRTGFDPKNSIKPESKLIKYPNEFKILVFR